MLYIKICEDCISVFQGIPNRAVLNLVFLCHNDLDDLVQVLILPFCPFGFHCKEPCDTKSNTGFACFPMKRD